MSTHYYDGKHRSYGPGLPDGEVVPEGAVPRPIVDTNTHLVMHLAGGYSVVALPTDRRIESAWAEADALALTGADHNSRAKYLSWKFDVVSSLERKTRIQAVEDWMDSIWGIYAVFRANILAGNGAAVFDLSGIGPCPWTFWDVAGA